MICLGFTVCRLHGTTIAEDFCRVQSEWTGESHGSATQWGKQPKRCNSRPSRANPARGGEVGLATLFPARHHAHVVDLRGCLPGSLRRDDWLGWTPETHLLDPVSGAPGEPAGRLVVSQLLRALALTHGLSSNYRARVNRATRRFLVIPFSVRLGVGEVQFGCTAEASFDCRDEVDQAAPLSPSRRPATCR